MDLAAEDTKLITLARSSRMRGRAAEGAAVRDLDGRTYTAAGVELPSLAVSALALAVAMAVSSGSRGLEAAALVTESTECDESGLAALREFGGSGVRVFLADAAAVPHTQVVS